jgi:hypothetical protein
MFQYEYRLKCDQPHIQGGARGGWGGRSPSDQLEMAIDR